MKQASCVTSEKQNWPCRNFIGCKSETLFSCGNWSFRGKSINLWCHHDMDFSCPSKAKSDDQCCLHDGVQERLKTDPYPVFPVSVPKFEKSWNPRFRCRGFTRVLWPLSGQIPRGPYWFICPQINKGFIWHYSFYCLFFPEKYLTGFRIQSTDRRILKVVYFFDHLPEQKWLKIKMNANLITNFMFP